jgi:hypothetical protein
MSPITTLLDQLPPPTTIHRQIGQLYRELALLRRLLRLSQAARENRTTEPTDRREVSSRA